MHECILPTMKGIIHKIIGRDANRHKFDVAKSYILSRMTELRCEERRRVYGIKYNNIMLPITPRLSAGLGIKAIWGLSKEKLPTFLWNLCQNNKGTGGSDRDIYWKSCNICEA